MCGSTLTLPGTWCVVLVLVLVLVLGGRLGGGDDGADDGSAAPGLDAQLGESDKGLARRAQIKRRNDKGESR
jgi:hypothetical protein